MKTVESARLFFQNDKSDKVYDVDLCEVENGLFVVNFRYGKRNSNLKEGTKTIFPVGYEEAKQTFDQLVLSKTKKGYLHLGQESDKSATPEDSHIESDESRQMQKAILRNLKDLKSDNYDKDWTASRIIWRVGELKIAETVDYIEGYLESNDFQEQYAAVWTLGRLKSKTSVDNISSLFKSTISAPIKNMCAAALLGFENAHQKETKEAIESGLPTLLKDAIRSSHYDSIKNGLKDFTQYASNDSTRLWVNLYLISFENEMLRKLLKERFEHISTQRNDFKAVRKIYKLSEFRDDYEFLAICAKKTAINPANYGSNSWAVWLDNKFVKIHEEKVKPDSMLAFSSATKSYFNRRTFRRLKKEPDDKTDNYIKLATEILLSVSDKADEQEEFSTYTYDENWELIEKWFPKYHLYTAYNFILFDGSERLELGSKSQSYSYLAGEVPNKDSITKREEHQSPLWDKSPIAVCKILSRAQVWEVNEFALKVFNANPHFKDSMTTEHLASMVCSLYENTASKAVELIKEIYDGKTLPFDLIIGLLSSPYEMAGSLGKEALKVYMDQGMLTAANIVDIILFGQIQPLELLGNVHLSEANKVPIHFSQIAPLVFAAEKYNESFIRALMKFIAQDNIKDLFAELNSVDIEQFIKAPRNYLQELGLLLIRVNSLPTHELAAPILDTFLQSEDHLLRAAAVTLMADFPNEFLLRKSELVLKFVFAAHKELRESIVAIVEKLVLLDDIFRRTLFSSLLAKICEQEEIEGSHQDHLALLQNCFSKELTELDSNLIIELLLSSVDAAQKLGEEQFHKQGLKQRFKIKDWVELKDADVFSIRAEIQHFYAENVNAVMADFDESLKVLESKWTDLRNWGMTYFMEQSISKNWTLEQILQVADSPMEDVQSFARSLISKLFSSSHGKVLMVHLSEHPFRSMMLFNSNYLNIYAKDHPEVIIQLKQYFKNILYGVNLGSASKARVFAFLMQELKKDEKVAKMTLEILSDILVTSAIGDKSSCIDLTLEIGEIYPHLDLPITVTPLNTYPNAIQS